LKLEPLLDLVDGVGAVDGSTAGAITLDADDAAPPAVSTERELRFDGAALLLS
jgi:hypothetical protein